MVSDFRVDERLLRMSEQTSTRRRLYKSDTSSKEQNLRTLAAAIEYVSSQRYKDAYLASLRKAGIEGIDIVFKMEGSIVEAIKTAEYYAQTDWYQNLLSLSGAIRENWLYYDERDQDLIYYRVDTVLITSLLAMMAGYYDSISIADFWLYFNPFLQLLIPGMPGGEHMISHETVRVVFRIAPADAIEEFYHQYFSGRVIDTEHMKQYFKREPVLEEKKHPAVLALDGQEVRGSYREGELNRKKKGAQQVSLLNTQNETVVASQTVQKKNQEDKAAVLMLSRLAVAVREGIVLMADAINTKLSFIKFLDQNNIDYLLPFKNNAGNKKLKKACEDFYNSNLPGMLQLDTIYDSSHGRIDTMKFSMFPVCVLPEEVREKYPRVKSIVVYEKSSQRAVKKISAIVDEDELPDAKKQTGPVTHTVHYYLSVRDCCEDALKECAYDIRSYWKVESHHYTLDTVFMQDRMNASNSNYLSMRLNCNKIVYNTLNYIRHTEQNPSSRGGNNRPMTFTRATRLCANNLFFAMKTMVEYFVKSKADVQEQSKTIPTVINATPLD